MRFKTFAVLACLGSFPLTALSSVSVLASGVELAPHRALYTMDLATTQSGSGIVGAHGTLSYEFADSCDGWVVENRMSIRYTYLEGGDVDTTTDFVTWESKDGLTYRFRLRNTRDGQVTDEIEGDAVLRGKGLGGNAHYTRPEEMTKALPKGTLFPTIHTKELVTEAQKGNRVLHRVVFDGSDTQGPFDVNAIIGNIRPLAKQAPFPQLNNASWPIRMAFFPMNALEAEPDFEMSIDYHVNGIAQSMMQGFKGFSLSGHLDSLEPVKAQVCQSTSH